MYYFIKDSFLFFRVWAFCKGQKMTNLSKSKTLEKCDYALMHYARTMQKQYTNIY